MLWLAVRTLTSIQGTDAHRAGQDILYRPSLWSCILSLRPTGHCPYLAWKFLEPSPSTSKIGPSCVCPQSPYAGYPLKIYLLIGVKYIPSDVIVLWRAWVLWNRRLLLFIPPLIFILCNVGVHHQIARAFLGMIPTLPRNFCCWCHLMLWGHPNEICTQES